MLDKVALRVARIATGAVLAIVILGIGLNGIGLLSSDANLEIKVRQAVGFLPTLFFVAAIGVVAQAIRSVEKDHAIEMALSKLMGRLGLCLFLGGISFVFIQPLLLKAFTAHWSSYLWFDVPAITLGCLGLLLLIVARPLRQAAAIRAELDEIL